MSSSSSSPVALEATSNLASSSSPLSPCPPRPRRPRRVLYPASRSRRLLPREAPDQARRWLLLLSALVFLQIYTEEAHTCTDPQNQCPDPSVCQPPQEGEGSSDAAWGRTEPWRVQTVSGASEAQLECVVA